jgi:hypothetical protein
MPEERIGELHPSAEWVEDEAEAGDGYWLRQQWTNIGDGSYYPILSAHLNGGRVSRYAGWIGAAGE